MCCDVLDHAEVTSLVVIILYHIDSADLNSSGSSRLRVIIATILY